MRDDLDPPGAAAPAVRVAGVPAHFPVLDTLRAVGAVAVLTTHVGFWSGAYTRYGIFGSLLARLDVGVAIFFVLSGFLLARPHFLRAVTASAAEPTSRYLWKRFLRIYPVYLVTAVAALWWVPDNADLGPRSWLTTLSLTNTYLNPTLPAGLTQMWSLEVEVAFYLVLPLVMTLVLGRSRVVRQTRVVGFFLLAFAIGGAWHLLGVPWVAPRVNGVPGEWLPGLLPWFAGGVLLAFAQVRSEVGDPTRLTELIRRIGALPGTCWAMAAGLLFIAATPLVGPTLLIASTPEQSFAKNTVYLAIALCLVGSGVFVVGDGRYARFMTLAPLRHLGLISYGVFCVHLPLMYLVMEVTGYQLFDGHFAQIWVFTMAVSVLAAEALYRWVEIPSRRLRGRGRRASRSAAAAPSTAARVR